MASPIPLPALDKILALQLTVAWAGETHGEPPHLGWWATSLSDPEGGEDFLKRMFPRTHVWAKLGAMREAARRVDERARSRMATPDALVTLFHFGFAWDEALRERLDEHKRASAVPEQVLGPAFGVRSGFDRGAFEKLLEGLAGKVAREIVPGGRQLTGPAPSPEIAALALAGGLLPLAAEYPMPFFHAKGEGR